MLFIGESNSSRELQWTFLLYKIERLVYRFSVCTQRLRTINLPLVHFREHASAMPKCVSSPKRRPCINPGRPVDEKLICLHQRCRIYITRRYIPLRGSSHACRYTVCACLERIHTQSPQCIQRVFVNGDLRDESCTPRQPGVPIQAITYMYTYMCPAYVL